MMNEQLVQRLKQEALQAFKQKNYNLSAQKFSQALEHNQQDIECLINLGVALKNAGQLAKAIKNLESAIELQPSNIVAHYNLGNCFLSLNDYQNAIVRYERCLQLNPSHVDSLLNLGNAHRDSFKYVEAENSYKQALNLRPDNAVVECNYALTLHKMKRYAEAVAHFTKASNLAPSYSEAFAGLGASYAELGDYQQAILANEKAIQVKPDYVEAINNLGVYLMTLARYDKAVEAFEKTIKLKPNHATARYNRGIVKLLSGDYPQGFRDYEERYSPKRKNKDRTILPHIFAPRWHGEDIRGKTILIWQEQGVGDAIQSAGFTRYLQQMGAKVWFATVETLSPVLATCPWIDRVVLKSEVGGLTGFDCWVMALSLPYLLEITPQNYEASTPYFFADASKKTKWQTLDSQSAGIQKQGLKIGLVWAGNPDHVNDKYRSMSASDLLPLSQLSGVQWYSLQVNETESNLLANQFSATSVGHLLNDYSDTASFLKELDLLVTVDTSVAHLAGALQVPTYLMLAANPDWRWLSQGPSTHWYSGVTLIRQERLGQWETVVESVKKAISNKLNGLPEFEPVAQTNQESLTGNANVASAIAQGNTQVTSVEASKPSNVQQTEGVIQTTDASIATSIEVARRDAREGRIEEAIAAYKSILEKHPDQPDALYGLGRAHFAKDQFEIAAIEMAQAIEKIKHLVPAQRDNFEGPWSRDLGVCYQRLGQEDKAVASFYKAQELRPDGKIGDWLLKVWTRREGANIQKAVAFHKAGKEKNAEKIYRDILARDENNGEALHLLGCILLNRKEYPEAERLIRKASRFCPSSHVYQRNLAALLIRSSRPDEAIRTWRHVLTLESIDENAIIDVANALMEHGAYQDAVGAYKKSLEKNPNNARSHASIGRAYTLLKSDDEAKAHLLRAEEIDPKMLDPQLLLSRIAVDQGNYEDATRYIQNCKAIAPRHPYVVWTDAFIGLGIYYETFEQSKELMKDFIRRMNSLSKYLSKATIPEIENAVGYRQPYELAYIQENNHDRLEAYGKAVALGMSRWQKDKKIPIPKPKKQTGKTRVGIVMGFFFNHSVWNALVNGWMTASPKDQIEFYVFHTRPITDKETQKAMQHATKFIPSPKSLHDWALAISEAECDVLIYPEIGMENMTVKLAGMRLAPVQVGSWGHAEGSGLPTLDYYLTGDLIEPPNAQDNYVEKVIRLPNLGCFIDPWDVTPEDIKPEDYGLDTNRPWLVSPGSPYKYRPEDDHMWLDVAKRLPQAQLIFFMHTRRQGVSNRIHGRLLRMFEAAGMKLEDHAVFIPWMSAQKFFGLMKRSTVYLDTIGFSGFNTAQQGLECGLPVVTLRGKFMRGLLGTALLERIDVKDMITENKQEYIELVAKLVEDPLYSEDVRSRIKIGLPKIYRDPEAIDGFVKFVREAHKTSTAGAK
jgi:protein O-GlcNAc transferase